MMNDENGSPAYPLGETLDFLGALWRLNRALERLSVRMERRLGVTAQQRFVVRCVGKHPGIIAEHLAQVLHLDPGTVSTALSRLEAKGLIQRHRADTDRRRLTIELTKVGRTLDRMMEGTVESAVEQLLREGSARDVASTRRTLAELTRLIDTQDQET